MNSISLTDSFFFHDDIKIDFTHKRSKIKNIYIKIKKQQILLSTPLKYSNDDAIMVLKKRMSWILRKLQAEQRTITLTPDEANLNYIYFLGELINTSDIIDSINLKSIDNFYTKQSKELVSKYIDYYSILMNLHPKSVNFKKYKRRMGSCDINNNLMFNIYLSRFNKKTIEYTVIHELAHIQEKNHSKNFYAIIKKYMPEYKKYII